MSTTAAEINVLLKLKDQMTKELSGFSKNFKKTMDNAAGMSKAVSVGVAAIGASLVLVGKKALEAANIQEAAEARLTQLATQAAGATLAQVEALKAHASALQDIGVVGDEVTMIGQGQLATFALQYDSIKTLTPAMLDMAVANKGVNVGQEDMINIGNMVGKVMQGQIGALSRLGVTFSEEQEKVLKFGTEQERAAALAQVLAQNFGGVNEALRDTTAGGIQAAKNAIGDLWEEIGFRLQPVISDVIFAFMDFVDQAGGVEGIVLRMEQAFILVQPWIPMIAGAIAGAMVPALYAAVVAMGSLIATAAPFVIAGAVIVGVVQGIITIVKNWDVIVETVRENLGKAWDWIKEKTDEIFTAIGGFLSGTWESIKGYFSAGLASVSGAWDNTWQGMHTVVMNTWESIKNSISASINWIIEKINTIIGSVNRVSEKIHLPTLPTIPRVGFAQGGIIPGFGSQDNVPINATPGELILNASQQRNLARNGIGGGVTINNYFQGPVSSREVAMEYADEMFNQFKYHSKVST